MIFVIFSLTAFECFSLDFRKLLIPEEVFKSGQQKRYETQNFKNANISPREWRIKKCYRNVSFEIFWKSKLCPGDIHTCVHSYAVEELQLFKNYRDYLLQISELCADGYVLDKQDRNFFEKSTQGEVDRFIKYVKETRKKIIDYENLQKIDVKSNGENIVREVKKSKSNNINASPVSPVTIKNLEGTKQSNLEFDQNKKELERLKKQLTELKKTEEKNKKQLEKMKKLEKKRLEELEVVKKKDEKRKKELEKVSKTIDQSRKEFEEVKKAEEKKQRELVLAQKAEEKKQKELELAKKQLLYVKKELESIKTEKADNLKKELSEMTRGDDMECIGKIEFQMQCSERNLKNEVKTYQVKKIRNFICVRIKTENNYSENSYTKVSGEIFEFDEQNSRFMVKEIRKIDSYNLKIMYDFKEKKKFYDINDPFSFERCK